MYDTNSSDTSLWDTSIALNTTLSGDIRDIRDNSSIQSHSPAAFLPWDNPDNLMTFRQYEVTAIITNCVLSPLLLFIGCPTNLVSCLVFHRQGLRDRMNLCLFVLGLADTAYLFSSTSVGLHSFIGLWDEEGGREYYAKVLVYFGFVMFGSKAISGCISTVVALERCVCVVFPLRANTLMRTRTMAVLLAAIVLSLLLGNSIMYFRNKVVSVYDAVTGTTHYVIVVTDFFVTHHLIYDVIYDIIISFLLPIVTFVLVGVSTAITVIKLKTAIAWRASTSSGKGDNYSQQQQAALTRMLVVLSCIFMACSAPQMVLGIVRFVVPDFSPFGRYSNFFYASHIVCVHFITPLNSAVNFFVYYFQSSRFKYELRALRSCGGGHVANSKNVGGVNSRTDSMTTATVIE